MNRPNLSGITEREKQDILYDYLMANLWRFKKEYEISQGSMLGVLSMVEFDLKAAFCQREASDE